MGEKFLEELSKYTTLIRSSLLDRMTYCVESNLTAWTAEN